MDDLSFKAHPQWFEEHLEFLHDVLKDRRYWDEREYARRVLVANYKLPQNASWEQIVAADYKARAIALSTKLGYSLSDHRLCFLVLNDVRHQQVLRWANEKPNVHDTSPPRIRLP